MEASFVVRDGRAGIVIYKRLDNGQAAVGIPEVFSPIKEGGEWPDESIIVIEHPELLMNTLWLAGVRPDIRILDE